MDTAISKHHVDVCIICANVQKHRKLREESASADLAARDKWLTKTWPTHRAKYAPEDIWNSNEGPYINDVRREGEGGG